MTPNTRGASRMTAAICAALVLVIAASAAYASSSSSGQTPFTFGRPGDPPAFSASCRRLPMYLTPAGTTWDGRAPNGKEFTSAGFSVLQAAIKCDNRRINRVIHCWHQPVPPVVGRFDHGAGRPGDWSGVDQLDSYIAAVRACTLAVTGDR